MSKPSYEDLQKRVTELELECEKSRQAVRQQQELQRQLAQAVTKILSGYIPICARCKRIRDEAGAWKQIETFIQNHTEAVFSHSLCPHCARAYFPEHSDARD
ncbi:MAG: hypothetical protein ACLFOY_16655 [Desulfatibacillaceae bacterium]